MAKTALTDRAIKAMRPAAKAYDTHDAVVPGLSLNVLPSGVKRFVLLRRFPGASIQPGARSAPMASSRSKPHAPRPGSGWS